MGFILKEKWSDSDYTRSFLKGEMLLLFESEIDLWRFDPKQRMLLFPNKLLSKTLKNTNCWLSCIFIYLQSSFWPGFYFPHAEVQLGGWKAKQKVIPVHNFLRTGSFLTFFITLVCSSFSLLQPFSPTSEYHQIHDSH